MNAIGQYLPTPYGFGQVPAEMATHVAGLFRDSLNRAKQHPASGYFSRKPFAERQNRYPSPMQGPDLIPVRSLYFFVGGALRRMGIALRCVLTDFGGVNAAKKGNGVCVEKSRLSPVLVCWASRAAATRYWSKLCLAPVQVLQGRLRLAATQPLARRLVLAPISSVRISATAADHLGGLTTNENVYRGHPCDSRAGGFFFARSRPVHGLRAFMGTE